MILLEDDYSDPQISSCLQLRQGSQQLMRIPCLRRFKYLLDRPHLDDPAIFHDGDPVAEILHDTKIMRDEDHRQPRINLPKSC